jgi:hypothetical protein
MIRTTVNLLDQYNIQVGGNSCVYVDGANPSFINALKSEVDEDPGYERVMGYYKKRFPSKYDLQFLSQHMFVIPVPFVKEHKHMLAHAKETMEYQDGAIAIHPRFTKRISSLRTAVEKGEGSLDKDATSHDDLFDAFRLSMMFWRRRA